jgi:TatA/E family protein of Tat protein translocase
MFNVGPTELILILILALIIFGPGKLPEVGKALGKAMSEFKKAKKDIEDEVHETVFKEDR